MAVNSLVTRCIVLMELSLWKLTGEQEGQSSPSDKKCEVTFEKRSILCISSKLSLFEVFTLLVSELGCHYKPELSVILRIIYFKHFFLYIIAWKE